MAWWYMMGELTMRKAKPLQVVAYPELVSNQPYLVRVQEIGAQMKKQMLLVRLVYLDREQDGRCQDIELPLPIRPAGRTAAFLRAAGVDVTVDVDIDPRSAIGRVMRARFQAPQDATRELSMCFEPAP